jgi:hypothetical protein
VLPQGLALELVAEGIGGVCGAGVEVRGRFQGRGCGDVAKAFQGSDAVTRTMKKREFQVDQPQPDSKGIRSFS